MKNAPAAAALVAALAAPASSEAMLDDPGTVYCVGTGGECKSDTPRDVIGYVRNWLANCKGVQVSNPVFLALPTSRGYFHARPRTPEAVTCMKQVIRGARENLQRMRLRSGVDPDHTDGRHIVIVDYRPQRKNHRPQTRGRGHSLDL